MLGAHDRADNIEPGWRVRSVTLRQCVVPAAALTDLLAPADGRPALHWLLREVSRFGVSELAPAGRLEGSVRTAVERVAAELPRPLAVAEPGHRFDERVLWCGGDAVFDSNLAPLLAAASADGAGVLARRGVIEGLACVAVADRRALDAAGEIRGAPEATALDGARARMADPVAREAMLRRLHRPALLLDRDGTINVDQGYVGTRERFAWIDAARAAIRRATAAGWHVFLVTNQSGVARGFYEEATVHALHAWLAEEVRRDGGTIDDVRYCPHHPDGVVTAYRRASAWRKPAPGMILDLIRAWELDPARCVMVGDRPTDMAAAAAAGIEGHLFTGGNLDAFVAPLLRTRSAWHGATLAAV
jgi:D-glycero-D-manno-heptose 1,7-bisphosphate phosphatase